MSLLREIWATLERSTAPIEAIQNIVTTIAIVAAAFWFIRRRLRFPRARVEHVLLSSDLGMGKRLLRVQARIENVGDVLMRLKSACIYVQQIRPLDSSIVDILDASRPDPVPTGECELPWPALVTRDYDWRKKRLEIEPGEVETCNFDVILPGDVRTVQVYTHIQNRVKWFKKLGWNTTSIYELNTEATATATSEAAEPSGSESSSTSAKEGLKEGAMADELKKQAPLRERPPLTQGPKKEPVPPPPQKKQ